MKSKNILPALPGQLVRQDEATVALSKDMDSARKKEEDGLVWVDNGEVIRAFPVSEDPVAALRGIGKGEGLLNRLLLDRQEDRERNS